MNTANLVIIDGLQSRPIHEMRNFHDLLVDCSLFGSNNLNGRILDIGLESPWFQVGNYFYDLAPVRDLTSFRREVSVVVSGLELLLCLRRNAWDMLIRKFVVKCELYLVRPYNNSPPAKRGLLLAKGIQIFGKHGYFTS
ncbi:hypothetical protein BCS86_17890 [Vibrio splendidus]|uniref:hypothetical protein n=1 Tax=Vibrio crassostreae TaxID=246167 RepID=UPI000C81CDE0|nr:hypothetical protein BCS86_17890 [Vibrio splendidus]